MKGKKYIFYLLAIAALASCATRKNTTTADSRYRRAPIHEVSQSQLNADSRMIDALGRQESGHSDEADHKEPAPEGADHVPGVDATHEEVMGHE